VPPLSDLPDGLRLSSGRQPPLLRCGYPVNRKLLGQLATDKVEGREIPDGMRAIRAQADWLDLRYKVVLNDGFEAIVEFSNNHGTVPRVPPQVIERVKEFLGEAGPPKWYLDVQKYRWNR
jgi:hypothetical protein